MKSRFIIGISAYYHESSVALFREGRLLCYLREEWLSRIKGDSTFPRLCLRFLKKEFEITEADIEAVCFYEKPVRNWMSIFHGDVPISVEIRGAGVAG